MSREKRRIVLPTKKQQLTSSDVQVVPKAEALMNDSYSIIQTELAYYRDKVQRGSVLSMKEARIVQNYLETLIKLSREQREQERHDDLSDLTDAQLMKLAAEMIEEQKKEEEKEWLP